jgi:hypothetical protein
MKTLWMLLLALNVFADAGDVAHRPPTFTVGAAKAVFVDFHTAYYAITYDIAARKAFVKARITFAMPEAGRPVFDLLTNPSRVALDGVETTAPLTRAPGDATQLRVVARDLAVGAHVLEVTAPIENLIEFPAGNSVKSAFWVTDLRDRYYLERYLPVNLEYDRVAMTFDVEFKGLTGRQQIFTNGTVTWDGDTKARVEFPAKWTMNSVYFHTTPVGAVEVLQFNYPGLGGRRIPVTVYRVPGAFQTGMATWRATIERTMAELERDFGPFPHESLTVNDADLSSFGLGGMEYAGATATSHSALGHELFHSWFARGVVPANGNAGWIDEALASWRDNRYDRRASLSGNSRMAGHSVYMRATDTDAYGFGAKFMAYLDGKLASKGGLKLFMRNLLETRAFRPLFTAEFITEMEDFAGQSLEAEFVRFTGHGSTFDESDALEEAITKKSHPIHKKMGEREWRRIL